MATVSELMAAIGNIAEPLDRVMGKHDMVGNFQLVLEKILEWISTEGVSNLARADPLPNDILYILHQTALKVWEMADKESKSWIMYRAESRKGDGCTYSPMAIDFGDIAAYMVEHRLGVSADPDAPHIAAYIGCRMFASGAGPTISIYIDQLQETADILYALGFNDCTRIILSYIYREIVLLI